MVRCVRPRAAAANMTRRRLWRKQLSPAAPPPVEAEHVALCATSSCASRDGENVASNVDEDAPVKILDEDSPVKILRPKWTTHMCTMNFKTMEPARVHTFLRAARSIRSEATQHLKTVEFRLPRELAKAKRLLCELACGVGQGELSDEFIGKHRYDFDRLSRELNAAVESAESIAKQAGHAIVELAAIQRGALSKEDNRAVRDAGNVMQNLVVLACSLELTAEEFATLQRQGLPDSMKARIASVLPGDAADDVMSRLGVAKYHLFTDGAIFSRRRARTKQKH